MLRNVKEKDKYSIVMYLSETTMIDGYGEVVVKCPTEDESAGYIRKLQREVD